MRKIVAFIAGSILAFIGIVSLKSEFLVEQETSAGAIDSNSVSIIYLDTAETRNSKYNTTIAQAYDSSIRLAVGEGSDGAFLLPNSGDSVDTIVVKKKQVFFYSDTVDGARRNAYLAFGDEIVVQLTASPNWRYCEFFNANRQLSKGFLKVSDLY